MKNDEGFKIFCWFMFAVIFAYIIVADRHNTEWRESHDAKLDSINYSDSIHFEHMKNCSYIDRESVKVGHNGVLYSHYHKTGGRY